MYNSRHDQHRIDETFKVRARVWLYLNKERLKGPSKNIKALWYGLFEVLYKVGDNSYRLSIPPYTCIYLVVNVENFKLYDPFYQKVEHLLPTTRFLGRVGGRHNFAKELQK